MVGISGDVEVEEALLPWRHGPAMIHDAMATINEKRGNFETRNAWAEKKHVNPTKKKIILRTGNA